MEGKRLLISFEAQSDKNMCWLQKGHQPPKYSVIQLCWEVTLEEFLSAVENQVLLSF